MTFKEALKHTLEFEGGYANDPADRGGETFRGVSRKNWPGWDGWNIIDKLKFQGIKKPRDIDTVLKNDQDMAGLVADFYKRNFWEPFDRLGLPPRATAKLFDTAVNVGVGQAVKFLQQSLNDCGESLVVDGKIGPATQAALVPCTDSLVDIIAKKQAAFYRAIVAKRPDQKKFLNGWLRRAAWVPA